MAQSKVLIENDKTIVTEWSFNIGDSTGHNTHKDNYIKRTDVRTAKHRYQGEDGRVISELIGGSKKSFGAKQILLSVADGYFVRHPTKIYL